MSNFLVPMAKEKIAEQIATMLNDNNQLYRKHNSLSILGGIADYFVEVAGNTASGEKVIGCVALEQEFTTLSKIKHLCVLPEYRRLGVARKLLNVAIQSCKTQNVYMTIREDNKASLRLASSLNFVFVKKDWSRDHNVITLGRSSKWQVRSTML